MSQPGVDDLVVDLIEDKHDELERLKTRTEVKLLRLSLTTGRGERVSPLTSYIEWLAVSYFRHWIADTTAPTQSGILKDSSSAGDGRQRTQPNIPPRLVRAFHTIHTAGQSYLTHDECKRFLKLRPGDYSRDNLRRFERALDQLKHLASEAVRPLTRQYLELDLVQGEGSAGAGAETLTCTRVEERDFSYIWS